MANTIFGGFIEALAPALQAQQESTLKQKMLQLQMQQFEAQQRQVQAEAQAAAQKAQLMQAWKTASTPEERQLIEREISLSSGKIPGQSVAEQMRDYQTVMGQGGMPGMAGGGDPNDPYSTRMDMVPSFGPKGMSLGGQISRPSDKAQEVMGLLYNMGINPNDKMARLEAASIINAAPEARYLLMQQFQAKYGGQGQQAPQPPIQGEGISAIGPDGQPIMFDNPEVLEEYKRRGFPLGPQGGAQAAPQQPQYAGGGGSDPYATIRARETSAAIQRAGGEERARTMAEGLSHSERGAIGAVQSVNNLVDELGEIWQPGFTGIETIGAGGREKTGAMSPQETRFRTIYNNLKRLDVRASAGLSQTAVELENAIAALGEPGLSDEVFTERLNTVRGILRQARDIDEQLMVAPRGEVPGILQRQRQQLEEQRQQRREPSVGTNGEAQEGTIIRNPKTGARLRLQNGRWTPVGPQ